MHVLINTGGTLLEARNGVLVSHTDYGQADYDNDVRSDWEIR